MYPYKFRLRGTLPRRLQSAIRPSLPVPLDRKPRRNEVRRADSEIVSRQIAAFPVPSAHSICINGYFIRRIYSCSSWSTGPVDSNQYVRILFLGSSPILVARCENAADSISFWDERINH